MKKILKNISRVLFSLLLVFSIFGVVNVLAEEVIFKITKIEVKEKSDTVTVKDVSLVDGQLNNDIEFVYKDDYIKYNITIKNNSSNSYKIKSLSNDNTSENLEYTYDDLSNVKIAAGEEKTFGLQIKYIKQVNTLKVTDKAVSLTLTYEKADGTTGTEIIANNNIINPKTGDNITVYMILGVISVVGLVVTTVSKKHLSKSLMVVALASSVILPLGVKADSDKFIVKFNNTINSYRGAGLYDEDDYLVIDYNKFVAVTNFDVNSNDTILYVYDPESNIWIEGNYITKEMAPIEYENIPDSSLIKTFSKEEYSKVSKIILPDDTTKIGEFKFSGLANLKEVVLPNGVTEIGLFSFMTTGIEKITIPNTVTKIGMSAFMNCTNLKTVDFEKNSTLSEIGETAFERTTSLEEVTIPSSVTTIGKYPFEYSGLRKLVFEKNSKLTELPETAFYYNESLEEVILPDHLIEIPKYAFTNTKLKTVTIPASVVSTGHAAFHGCTELETVIFEEGSNFKTLGDSTFGSDKKLKNIVLPPSLTTIEYSAFSQCEGLETINIPANVTFIGPSTFYHNYSLTTAYFVNPNGWSHYYGENVNNQTQISSTSLADPEQAATALYQLNLTDKWIRN